MNYVQFNWKLVIESRANAWEHFSEQKLKLNGNQFSKLQNWCLHIVRIIISCQTFCSISGFNVPEMELGWFLVVSMKFFLMTCSTQDTTNPYYKPQIWAVPQPPPFSCIANADEAAMINLQSRPWNHRSPLNHAGFMAWANPLCSDHRERHQTSGTNTLVWGAFALSCIIPPGLETAQRGEDSASLWLRNTPVAPVLAWCRHWTVAPGLPGPR